MPDEQPLRDRITVSTLAVVTLGLGLLALVTPFSGTQSPTPRIGGLLALASGIEVLHALRRPTAAARRRATIGGMISMAIALFLINAPFFAAEVLRLLVAGWFALDAVRGAIGVVRASHRDERVVSGLAALGNLAVAILLVFARGWVLTWIVSIAGAMRIFGIAWNILVVPVHDTTEADETVVSELGLTNLPGAAEIAADVEQAERVRAPIDLGWTRAFIATLFAIHAGRMSTDLTILGMISPAVAVLGDMLIAVLITLLVINPVYLMWRAPTRWLERLAWRWRLGDTLGRRNLIERIADAWLRRRLRFAIRLREARYSIPAALSQGLQSGLPLAAILAATVPVWGMSWYFDTENWAAGMWNSWAESRTDTWREAMARAVLSLDGSSATGTTFVVEPRGAGPGDFSFIVIGDPGEGDASQHVMRDQLLTVASQPDVRFIVVSSDVVYPTGSMKDYEAKFWLPFKGITRPVYAIPGNHDWYDALEAFAATFLQADAARASIRARAEADLRVTSTTNERVDDLIRGAEQLRRDYGVPTGFQRAPFFEMQTDRFALIAVDTGVLRRIDPVQSAWLDAALDRASGKFIMAILGHPFFAGGQDVTTGDEDFARIRNRLLARAVRIVMAGDTHDLEYYNETSHASAPVHHFVNGGGGAYLSFGTSLAWPATPPTAEWAYYPNQAAVTRKIEDHTPWWKRPAWWWTREFGAWPFTAEWLSAAFDYNVAPFFQSFVEVRVEPSANRVRIIPYGVHGRLAWDDVASSARADGSAQRFVEWVVPMPSAGSAR
jgi:uncharacterized membrane protein HdeD (DUF308 family)/3',5'-cyclic AMP phosphodiesterase CpdA